MDQVAVVPFGSPWSRRNVPPCCSARTARLPDPAERLFEHVKHSPFQHRPVALHGTRVVGREFDGDVPGASLGTSNSGFDDVIEPTSGGRVVGRSVASNRFEVTDQRSKLGGLGAKIVKEGGVVVGVGELPGGQDLDVGLPPRPLFTLLTLSVVSFGSSANSSSALAWVIVPAVSAAATFAFMSSTMAVMTLSTATPLSVATWAMVLPPCTAVLSSASVMPSALAAAAFWPDSTPEPLVLAVPSVAFVEALAAEVVGGRRPSCRLLRRRRGSGRSGWCRDPCHQRWTRERR